MSSASDVSIDESSSLDITLAIQTFSFQARLSATPSPILSRSSSPILVGRPTTVRLDSIESRHEKEEDVEGGGEEGESKSAVGDAACSELPFPAPDAIEASPGHNEERNGSPNAGGTTNTPDSTTPLPRPIKQEKTRRTSGGISALLVQEEIARLHLHRVLNEVHARTERTLQYREHCRKEALTRKQILQYYELRWRAFATGAERRTEEERKMSASFGKLYGTTWRQACARQAYLDDALYGDIVDKLEEGNGESGRPRSFGRDDMADMRRMTRDVQHELLRQFQHFDVPLQVRTYYTDVKERLMEMFKVMQRELWFFIQLSDLSKDGDEDEEEYFVHATVTFLAAARTPPRPPRTGPSSITPLVDIFISNVAMALARGIEFDMQDDPTQTAGPRKYPAYDAIRSCQEEEYRDWMLEGCDTPQIARRLSLWRGERRAETVQEFKRTMLSVHTTVQQEFIHGATKPDVVTLVLFKGGHPVTIKDVDLHELRSLGWTYDESLDCRFWRYEVFEDDFLLKVSMDGEVLGMLARDGRYFAWIG